MNVPAPATVPATIATPAATAAATPAAAVPAATVTVVRPNIQKKKRKDQETPPDFRTW